MFILNVDDKLLKKRKKLEKKGTEILYHEFNSRESLSYEKYFYQLKTNHITKISVLAHWDNSLVIRGSVLKYIYILGIMTATARPFIIGAP